MLLLRLFSRLLCLVCFKKPLSKQVCLLLLLLILTGYGMIKSGHMLFMVFPVAVDSFSKAVNTSLILSFWHEDIWNLSVLPWGTFSHTTHVIFSPRLFLLLTSGVRRWGTRYRAIAVVSTLDILA